MKNFVENGHVVEIALPYDRSSGQGVQFGAAKLFGVCAVDGASGDSINVQVDGIFDIAKDGSSFTAGDIVYWDNTNKVCTSTATSNTKIGVAMQAQVTGDATVRVRLNGTV